MDKYIQVYFENFDRENIEISDYTVEVHFETVNSVVNDMKAFDHALRNLITNLVDAEEQLQEHLQGLQADPSASLFERSDKLLKSVIMGV